MRLLAPTEVRDNRISELRNISQVLKNSIKALRYHLLCQDEVSSIYFQELAFSSFNLHRIQMLSSQ